MQAAKNRKKISIHYMKVKISYTVTFIFKLSRVIIQGMQFSAESKNIFSFVSKDNRTLILKYFLGANPS